MTKELKLEIRVTEVTKKDGSKFLAYKVLTKKSGWYDLRFTRDCENMLPTKNSYIYVLETNVNVNKKSRFPVVWVSKIEKVETIDYSKISVEDYFD